MQLTGSTSACRAGNVGLLDFAASAQASNDTGMHQLHSLSAACRLGAAFGVRVSLDQLCQWPELLAFLANYPKTWLLLAGWEDLEASKLISPLSALPNLYLEISTPQALTHPLVEAMPAAGWLGRPAATDDSVSIFILLQALARQQRPFLAMAVSGPEASAAARIAGACGVVVPSDRLTLPIGIPASSVARALHRLRKDVDRIDALVQTGLFAPGNPLAQANGTEFPVVQGPMTRVSDNAEFAAAVARSGALPMLALALHSAAECNRLMTATQALVGARPWGVGLLGFAPPQLLAQQLALVYKLRPPFCVLSGGRPDQVAALEREGTTTYLHVPVPELIEPYSKRGVRRFIFEGSECGGHTGPLDSFTLWGRAVEVLLTLPAEILRESSVLFAGGIHDALSSAVASAFAARLSEAGVKTGVLMGTAYVFTEEIVDAGAVVPAFQAEALQCQSTARIATGPGHVIRCAPTPFIEEFALSRVQLEASAQDAREVSEKLEALTLGRANAASRGLWHDPVAGITSLDAAGQQRLGMYMMGEVAAFRDRVTTMRRLHRDVSVPAGATVLRSGCDAAKYPLPPAEPIAIIGMSGLVPGATTLDGFWRLLLDGGNPITEIPESRFDWRMIFDENSNAPDKIYSRWGGFLDEIAFDPMFFGIPPLSMHSISPMHLLSLEVARRALADAGYDDRNPEAASFDRENTSICLGASSGADLHHMYIVRSTLPFVTAKTGSDTAGRLPEWTEESFSGNLLNVMAGRISNRFNLGGSNRTIDAACASSLAAIQIAVADLQSGRTNLAISGGVDLDQTAYSYMAFSKTHALSPRGVALPFDRKADGIVLSEGVVMLVLKRLSDAEREGDRIYAVIRSVEGSSDGRGKSLTSPLPAGQRRALDRAYAAAAIDASSLGLYEAHGTGTVVGDKSELETISGLLADASARPASCAIGSAKGLLGHTKSAAGAVGIIKTAMALHHRVLPPLHNLTEPLAPLLRPDSGLCSYDQATPWLAAGQPRRAGVSAFGFGGTNFHAVLEEYTPALGATGANAWSCELVLLTAPDTAGLICAVDALTSRLSARPLEPLAHLALSYCRQAGQTSGDPLRLALVAQTREHLINLLAQVRQPLCAGQTQHHIPDLHLQDLRLHTPGELGFLFPGQGSQYVGMGRELALYTPELRTALEFGDSTAAEFGKPSVSRIILPPNAFGKEGRDRQAAALNDTAVAQPALGIVSCGMLDFALRLGLHPAAVAGHSYGELVALHAAGVLSRAGLLRLSFERGRTMRDANLLSPGAMAAVNASEKHLLKTLNLDNQLTVANFNAPRQHVLSGTVESVEKAVAILKSHGIAANRLPVSAAFHSPAMAPAALEFAHAIDAASLAVATLPIYSNFEGCQYPAETESIRSLMKQHLCRPVHFEAEILAMYDAGVRTFFEIGPRQVLTGLTEAILEGKPVQCIALDGGGGGLRGTLNSLAQLWSSGVPCDLLQLSATRSIPAEPAAATGIAAEWVVDGGRVRGRRERIGLVGSAPLITIETELPRALAEFPAATTAPAATELLAAYSEYQQTMRGLIDSQERVLSALVQSLQPGRDSLGEPLPAESPARAQPQPSQAVEVTVKEDITAASAAALDITAIVLEAVSKRTGYPTEFIKLDYDIEADIGVDSIKRIDILLEIEGRMPASAGPCFEAGMNDLNQFRTVRGLVAMLEEIVAASTNVNAAVAADSYPIPPVPGVDEAAIADETTCPRFIMQYGASPSPPQRSAPLSGLCLVTEDELGISSLAASSLRQAGLDVALLTRADLGSVASIESRLAELEQTSGTVQGILHLAGLTSRRPATESDWALQTQIQLKGLLQLAQHLARAAKTGHATHCPIVAATGFGGFWGREHAVQTSCLAGGVHGLLRTAQLEHPELTTTVVDFDPGMPPAQIAEALLAELCAAEMDPEVGYREGQRYIFFPVMAPQDTSDSGTAWAPTAGSVVVVTGGARGITAHIAEDFARPGVQLILVGRGRVGDSHAAGESVEEIRHRVIQFQLEAGQQYTPAVLEARVQEEIHRHERAITLARLRATGADVSYAEVDVTDQNALRLYLRSVYALFGHIDVLIHGAGVLDDMQFLRKTPASFDRVFRTKTDALRVFEEELRPDSLRAVVLFSSISGRFGNAGQCDYAAANEVLVRWAWLAKDRWPGVRALAVCWGPWLGAGMAGNGVLRGLRERGILSLEPADAARFLLEELNGSETECEVIVGDGFWRSVDLERDAQVMTGD